MSEELIAQLKTDDRFKDLSPAELERIAELTLRLRDLDLFKDVSDVNLAYIAQRGRLVRGERGDVLIEQGSKEKLLYVILRGQLRVWKKDEQGQSILLDYRDAGDFVGELIFMGNEERSATVDMMDDAEVVAFDEEGYERIAKHSSAPTHMRRWGPERYRDVGRPFPGKQPDEVTIVRAHKNWIALARVLLFPIAIVVVSVGITFLFSLMEGFRSDIALSANLAIVVGMILWSIWMWEDWRNDDFIVTSKRVIHIERLLIPPFPVERREAPIERVQDITLINQGIWTILFRVQTMEVRTMAAGIISFPYLTEGPRIRDEIFAARDMARIRKQGEERTRIREKLFEEFGHEVKQITPLETVEWIEKTPERTGLLAVVDYFIPRTRVVRDDQITWRKHWFFLLVKVWVPVLLFVGAMIALGLGITQPGILGEIQPGAIILPALLVAVIAFVWYIWNYDGWRNDIYIVTDERIIDIEGSPFHLFKETRREGGFEIIQNINYESPNLFYRILRIGDITMDTAAQQAAYTFDNVARPSDVHTEIIRRLVAYREQQEARETQRRYDEISKWFEVFGHDVLGRQG
jgi:hypothetical protein